MERLQSLVAIFCAVFLLRYAWRILNSEWLRPKRLEEKWLREQGLRGNTYRLFYGDTREESMMMKEARSKPMSFSNDFVPRVLPNFIVKTINNYGKNSYFWQGPKPAVLIMDPEQIREVLSKANVYHKVPLNPLAKLLGQGVATYETEKWAKHKRIINPVFHQEKLKHMLPAFYLSCCEMINKWEKIVSTKQSCELDVLPYLHTLTSDAISRTAFGSNYEEGRRIFELQKEQAELAEQVARSVYLPGWRFQMPTKPVSLHAWKSGLGGVTHMAKLELLVCTFVPTKRNKRPMELVKEVNSSILDVVTKRGQAIEAGEASNDDLLLQSNNTEIQQHGSKSGGMSMEEIVEVCKLFFLAGQETTALLLVWAMILLSKHLDWQTRAREEVLDFFRGETPDFDELNNLKIVTMILHEVLRLYSPGIRLLRTISNETKLGKLSLPAGVLLIMPLILVHHDTEIWGDDAEEFNPERFREGVSKANKGQFAFFLFGWGPRICMGQQFAMLGAKMALVMMLQRFTLELSPSYTHAPATVVSLQPQHGALLRLHKL